VGGLPTCSVQAPVDCAARPRGCPRHANEAQSDFVDEPVVAGALLVSFAMLVEVAAGAALLAPELSPPDDEESPLGFAPLSPRDDE